MVIVVAGALLILVAVALLWLQPGAIEGSGSSSEMIGLEGVAQDNFSQEGTVLVMGELWKATTTHGIITRGDRVVVRGRGDGLILIVERITLDS
jgi:membrane-bound ClpP family serine protease